MCVYLILLDKNSANHRQSQCTINSAQLQNLSQGWECQDNTMERCLKIMAMKALARLMEVLGGKGELANVYCI